MTKTWIWPTIAFQWLDVPKTVGFTNSNIIEVKNSFWIIKTIRKRNKCLLLAHFETTFQQNHIALSKNRVPLNPGSLLNAHFVYILHFQSHPNMGEISGPSWKERWRFALAKALVGEWHFSGVKLRGCWILGEYQIIYDYRTYYIAKEHHINKRLSWWWRQLTTVRSHNAAASRIQEGEPTWGGRMPPASWLFVYGQMMQGFLRMPDPKVTMAFTTKSSNLDDFGVLPF